MSWNALSQIDTPWSSFCHGQWVEWGASTLSLEDRTMAMLPILTGAMIIALLLSLSIGVLARLFP